jgi:ankyrin repeat protein
MINSRALLALLLVALISAANGHALAMEGATSQPLNVARLTLGLAERQTWIRAISNDQVARLRLMFAQYDQRQLLAITASNGKNALMVASKQGDLPLVKSLVKSGARIDATTETNGTAFMFAVLGNQSSTAQWLFTQGADINVVGANGWSAIMIAAAKGHDELLQWLIQQGAYAQVRDVYRFTPLMRAVQNDHESAVRLLLSLPDTDINARDEYDNTPLHHAVSAGNPVVVRLLLDHGADRALLNRAGQSPVMMTAGNEPMETLLK